MNGYDSLQEEWITSEEAMRRYGPDALRPRLYPRYGQVIETTPKKPEPEEPVKRTRTSIVIECIAWVAAVFSIVFLLAILWMEVPRVAAFITLAVSLLTVVFARGKIG